MTKQNDIIALLLTDNRYHVIDTIISRCQILTLKEDILANQKGKPLPEGGRTVRVFTLDGKPLKQYKLDHSISGIWVDEQAGKMWALDVNSDDPLVEYALK